MLRAKSDDDDERHDNNANVYEKIGIFGVYVESDEDDSEHDSAFENTAIEVGEMTLI